MAECNAKLGLIISLEWGVFLLFSLFFWTPTTEHCQSNTHRKMANLKGCEGAVKVFCHLGLCHTFTPLKDTSNDVLVFFVIKSCAGGYVKAGFEKNSTTVRSI